MPIEIKELHIKINVDQGASNKGQNSNAKSSENQESLISSCVEAVMGILENQKER